MDTPSQQPDQSLAQLGEQGFLNGITRRIAARSLPEDLLVGPGDDAAIWRHGNSDLVLSQDALVEGVDWIAGWMPPRVLGARALRVAISDLAAMGATPLYALATLCVPSTTSSTDAYSMLDGMLDAASTFGCALIGGDVSDIDGPTVIDISVAGTCSPGRALRRDTAEVDDLIVVTGTLGRAAAGLAHLKGEADFNRTWNKAWMSPQPRFDEAYALSDAGVQCAGDISDGLLADLNRTARASNVGIEVWADCVPIDNQLRTTFGQQWLELATGRGEDFELVATVNPESVEGLSRNWPSHLAPLTIVGRVTTGPDFVMLTSRHGKPMDMPAITSGHYR